VKNKDITPLEKEKRTHISTREAAFFLSLQPQTLRSWECPSNPFEAPIKPLKIGNKLLWSVKELKKLLGI
jgi:hypothetical protein